MDFKAQGVWMNKLKLIDPMFQCRFGHALVYNRSPFFQLSFHTANLFYTTEQNNTFITSLKCYMIFACDKSDCTVGNTVGSVVPTFYCLLFVGRVGTVLSWYERTQIWKK